MDIAVAQEKEECGRCYDSNGGYGETWSVFWQIECGHEKMRKGPSCPVEGLDNGKNGVAINREGGCTM